MEYDKVNIKCATEGASIAYQLNQPDGSNRWFIYTEPVLVKQGDRLRAVAQRTGYKLSAQKILKVE